MMATRSPGRFFVYATAMKIEGSFQPLASSYAQGAAVNPELRKCVLTF